MLWRLQATLSCASADFREMRDYVRGILWSTDDAPGDDSEEDTSKLPINAVAEHLRVPLLRVHPSFAATELHAASPVNSGSDPLLSTSMNSEL